MTDLISLWEMTGRLGGLTALYLVMILAPIVIAGAMLAQEVQGR